MPHILGLWIKKCRKLGHIGNFPYNCNYKGPPTYVALFECFENRLGGGSRRRTSVGFFIGFSLILPSQIQLANKMVRLIQYEGTKFGQCGPLTTQDGQV